MKLQSYPIWLASILFFCLLTATSATPPAQADGGGTGNPPHCTPGIDC